MSEDAGFIQAKNSTDMKEHGPVTAAREAERDSRLRAVVLDQSLPGSHGYV
jgi:hypothetical protein